MPQQPVLIVDSEGPPCAHRCGDQLHAALEVHVACRRIGCASQLQAWTTASPEAVLLLAGSADELMRLAQGLRRIFAETPFLGVLHRLDAPPPRFFDTVADYVLCPFQDEDIALRVHRILADGKAAGGKRQETPPGSPLIGESAVFLQTKATAERIARANATCLIEGETGTGKELFARAIHYSSRRSARPFVPLNCGALPDQLIDSELFGHVKGAYTDARSAAPGLIAYAEDGDLFLDEVDALSPAAQIKLLRVIQEGEYRPVGSVRTQRTAARILAASNADLRAKVRRGEFREDLFHRLNVLRLRVPPLRERADDTLLLARHFLEMYAAEHDNEPRVLSPDAVLRLRQYAWPGNVRELEGVIQRAVMLACGMEITAADFDLGDQAERPPAHGGGLACAKLQYVGEFERAFLLQALGAHCGNVSRAARAAGKDRRSFQRLLKKHGITSGDYRLKLAG